MVSMVRVCTILLLAAFSALPQSLSVGLKGGVPLTNALKAASGSAYFSDRAPFVLGPSFEVGLPLGLSVEVDALYRRVRYNSTNPVSILVFPPPPPTTTRTTGQVWEFPFLVKYRVAGGPIRPYLSAGLSFRRLASFDQRTFAPGDLTPIQSTDQPQELKGRNAAGPTVGGGLEFRVPFLRISTEIRYTRWGSSSFRSALGGLATQLNQADFLLGIAF